jgi:cell cycle sensor histidine kinase DivJ
VTVMLPLTLVPGVESSNNIATLTPASRSGKQDQDYRVRKSA